MTMAVMMEMEMVATMLAVTQKDSDENEITESTMMMAAMEMMAVVMVMMTVAMMTRRR